MIQVIQRALDILEYIANDPDKPKPLGEIAGDLKLNAGTCANIIKTLTVRQYLEKIDKQKGYCLGARAYGLTGTEGYRKKLVYAAKEEMELLTQKMNENSLLCILKGEIRLVIHKTQSSNDLQVNTSAEKKAYDTASGRLLVAMQSTEEIEKYIDKYGLPATDVWQGITDKKYFLKQLAKIRKEGYAMQVTSKQIVGVALPVYENKAVIASLSVYMPLFRFNSFDRQDIIKQVKRRADRISRKLE